jgi:proteasome lid subunit RPN8/RPN11
MDVRLTPEHLREIEAHGEASYPNEGGGFLLGSLANGAFEVAEVLPIDNEWDEGSQHNRFAIKEQTSMNAQLAAIKRGLDVVGVFHSHPDHPAEPSNWDLEWATWPNFSFLITRVDGAKASLTRAWRLADDRQSYQEDTILTR